MEKLSKMNFRKWALEKLPELIERYSLVHYASLSGVSPELIKELRVELDRLCDKYEEVSPLSSKKMESMLLELLRNLVGSQPTSDLPFVKQLIKTAIAERLNVVPEERLLDIVVENFYANASLFFESIKSDDPMDRHSLIYTL